MSSLRAVARIRAISPFSFTRAISTRGGGPESDRGKRPTSHRPSLVDNAPGWNEDLATASEAVVKADRAPTSLGEMQQKTVDYVHWHVQREQHDPEVEQTHATYAREEVGGPLGHAGMSEFEGVVGSEDLGPDEAGVTEPDGHVVTRRVTREETTVRDGDPTNV